MSALALVNLYFTMNDMFVIGSGAKQSRLPSLVGRGWGRGGLLRTIALAMTSKNIFLFLFLFLSLSCKENSQKANQAIIPQTTARGDSVYFARGFHIETHEDYTLATVRNPWNDKLILQRYILVPKTDTLPDSLPEGILIRTPLARTVCYGSVQCGFMSEFDALFTLVGVCEPQYIHIPYVQENIRNGNIVNLGQAANPDLEKIMLIEPEALFTAPIENLGYGQTAKLRIPIIECVDYMEPTPLGRAEWIRFLALFFDKKEIADSLFRETVNRYGELVHLTESVARRPTVFAETVYSGIWYQPGGNSYIAQLFRDAGADYLWKEDTNTGSIALTFESVLDKAEKADFWLIKYNNPLDMTYRKLVREYSNYALFDAYQKRNIYICNMGKVPYFEELPIHPDWILKDIVGIFHSELLPDYQSRYYKKME